MKHYFVTAIGTDSGKTVVSSILAKAWNYSYWKPIQSGEPKDSDIVRHLTNNEVNILPEQYIFRTPASPHYAAEVEKKEIYIDQIIPPKSEHPLIIEGAGGLMVPLNTSHLMIDLIKKLDCIVVLVSNIYLGSINHTLLSIEALEKRGISVDHLVFNGHSTPSTENIIVKYSNVPVLFRLDQEQNITPAIIDYYASKIRNR